MKTGNLQTLVFAAALVAFVTGCAGPPRIAIPVETESEGGGERSVQYLSVGDQVRLEMNSGEVVEGRVERISSGTATIGRATNFGYEEATIALADIRSLESESLEWAVVKVVLTLTAVAAILTLGTMYGAGQ